MFTTNTLLTRKNEPGIYKRNFKIDLLRGFSILFVILLHLNIRVAFNGTALGEILPQPLYKLLFWSGIYGVEIFFTVSGFLITQTALSRYGTPRDVKPADFYKNRLARIAPLLLLLLAVLSLLDMMGVENYVVKNGSGATLGKALLAALTFSVNWLEMETGYLPGAWDVLWSLSVEEVFYIAFPLVCLVCRRHKTLFVFMLALVIISPLFRSVWFTASEFEERNNFACMGAMAAGCIGGIAASSGRIKRNWIPFMKIAGWILFASVMLLRPTLYQIGLSKIGLNFTMLSVGTALLLVSWWHDASSGRNRSIIGLSFIADMGKHSYEIYLSHMFIVFGGVSIFESINNSSDASIYLLYASVLILASIAGKLLARFYTDPLNKYIRNLPLTRHKKA